MPPLAALALLVALVVASTAAGLLVARRPGRVRAADVGVTADDLGLDAPFGERATLVQLSTRYCAVCPATARLLGGLAAERSGVVHREVDLGAHPDVADRFGVLQTPTVLLVDAGRRVRGRIGGAPDRGALVRELDTLLEPARAR